jgi:hypothetical protein
MHIIRTKAVLIRTQTLSAAFGAGVAEISMLRLIKQNPCHKLVSTAYPLAISLFRDKKFSNDETSAQS